MPCLVDMPVRPAQEEEIWGRGDVGVEGLGGEEGGESAIRLQYMRENKLNNK